METNQMYDEMVIYIEACESGSMFPDLTSTGKIYGVTASNATQSSWASYCGSEATVNGVSIGSCLGDLFSTNWMEDTDAAIAAGKMDTETLTEQFNTVQTETTRSPVLKFGDFSFMSEAIGEFEGTYDETSASLWTQRMLGSMPSMFTYKKAETREHVDQRDSLLHYLYNRVITEGGDEAHAELVAEVHSRNFYDSVFAEVFPGVQEADLASNLEDYDCYRFMIDSFEESCGVASDYGRKYFKHLRHVCAVGGAEFIGETAQQLSDACQAFQ